MLKFSFSMSLLLKHLENKDGGGVLVIQLITILPYTKTVSSALAHHLTDGKSQFMFLI